MGSGVVLVGRGREWDNNGKRHGNGTGMGL